MKAIDLFEKYNAHATFFISGEIDEDALLTMKCLRENGHSIGLHSLRHSDAPQFFEKFGGQAYLEQEIYPQLEACQKAGIFIQAFAYPNNRRTTETDRILSTCFRRFRAGLKESQDDSSLDRKPKGLKQNPVMNGIGIGEYYNTDNKQLIKIIQRVAKENTVITFFSHDIAQNASSIHTPTATLELILQTAQDMEVRVVGFNELP